VGATSITQSGVVVSWTLNEPATGQVEYGLTSAYGSATTPELSFNWSYHIQQVSGLSPGTLYHYRVRSQDAAGYLSISGDYTFTTLSATPSPTPTTAPSPTPTTAPSPTPTAAPSPTPTPTPTTAVTGIALPSSIDATGATDVSAALASFINGLPSGSTVVFKTGGTYRVDSAIKLGGRTNLTLEGQGATIAAHGSGYNENYSLFYFQTFPGTNSGIKIHNFNLVGSSPTPGTFISGKEGQHGVLIDGGSGFEVSGNSGSGFYGDFVEVNSGASNVRVHDNSVANVGRNYVSVITGSHVEVDHNTFPHAGYMPFDVEPNTASQSSSYIDIHDNLTGYWSNAFFALDGSHTGAAISNVSVRNNSSIGRSLLTVVNNGGTTRDTTIVFSGNRSDTAAGGPVLRFAYVDGLTVTGNVQPVTSGSLASFTSCTGVTYP